jgi:hypothetical protein
VLLTNQSCYIWCPHNQQTQSDVGQSAPKVAVQESAQQSSKQSGSAGLSSAQMCKGGVLQMSETSHISPGLSQGQSRGNPVLSQQAGRWLARSVVTMPSGGSSLAGETDRVMVWRVDPQTCWREQLLQANIAYIAVHSARVRAQLAEGSLPGAGAADGLDADGSLPEAEWGAWLSDWNSWHTNTLQLLKCETANTCKQFRPS